MCYHFSYFKISVLTKTTAIHFFPFKFWMLGSFVTIIINGQPAPVTVLTEQIVHGKQVLQQDFTEQFQGTSKRLNSQLHVTIRGPVNKFRV